MRWILAGLVALLVFASVPAVGLSRFASADEDLDTVGRSAYPGGLDPELPLIDIVWWVSKELLIHSGEAWLVRDLYAHRR